MSIKLLDENTINKIAAGEVIENPSNVVKELIENALDSGAKNIEVSIEGGGTKQIKIVDDGSGFEKDDIKVAFLKHATSKLTKIEDIYSIASYGFRGEALSSIAAVSKVTLITKRKNEDKGYKYQIDFGKEIELTESASNIGTTIIVKDIFANVPVRKKFLKSEQKESSNVEDVINKFSYTRPDVAFKYVVDGNVKYRSHGDGKLQNVIYDTYGKEIYENLIKVDKEIRGIKVSGFITHPVVTRNNRNDEIYFINNRKVTNEIVTKAIEDAYSEYLMQHKFPLVVLMIYIDSREIDVNVHPKKEEVRFDNDDVVYFAIYNAIGESLANTTLIHNESLFDEKNDIEIEKNAEEEIVSEEEQTSKDINILPTLKDFLGSKSDASINLGRLFEKLEEKPFIQKTLTEDHKYIGQVFDTYILVEFDNKLYIIDQHAAHEKINYERLMKELKSGKVMSQKIFPSIMLRLTPMQYLAVEENLEAFKKLGYEIEIFGDNDIKVDAIPYNLLDIGKKELLLEMIDSFATDDKKEEYSSILDRLASMSCKKAIKAGHILSTIEVKNLLRELFKLDNPYNCPHGRPTIISLSKSEFEKRFGRIV